jgi:glycosyltransferase involved in cell wall biosynthesis
LRIAFDARSLTSPVLRGWDRYTIGLVGELVRQGIEVTLLHRQSQPLNVAHIASLGCHTLGLSDRGGLHWEQMAVPLALWRGKFDIYHAPAEHGVPLVAPCPVVLTVHSATTHSYRRMIERKLLPGELKDYLGYNVRPFDLLAQRGYHRLQLARASHILTPSDFCRAEVIELLGVSARRVTTTPLAAHDQFHRAPKGPKASRTMLEKLGVTRPYLLYVGGYEPHKNPDGLLSAFVHVKAARPDLSLVLVGSKAVPDPLRAKAANLGLRADRDVVLLCNLGEELTDLYDQAELFVSLSWRETFCLPALEAMTRGLPVVASAWGATREVVGDAGCLVDPRNHEAAAQEILGLLANTDREVHAKKVRNIAGRFRWEITAADTLKVYNRLILGNRRMAC